MKFDLDVNIYEPNSVYIPYEKIYPWKIPITVVNPTHIGIKKIEVEIIGDIDFDIKKHVKDILNFYSLNNNWTAGLLEMKFKTLNLTVTIKSPDQFIEINGSIYGEDGLPYRGCMEKDPMDPNVEIQISQKGCSEILRSRLIDIYEEKRKKENWEQWTFNGWVKHTLAHEMAHFVCVPYEICNSINEILAQLFATHYDIENEPVIHVPSGSYLKNHWSKLRIDPNDYDKCRKKLEEVFRGNGRFHNGTN